MKVVIVGGVAGGASAAARIRRLDEHAQIIMIAVSYTHLDVYKRQLHNVVGQFLLGHYLIFIRDTDSGHIIGKVWCVVPFKADMDTIPVSYTHLIPNTGHITANC